MKQRVGELPLDGDRLLGDLEELLEVGKRKTDGGVYRVAFSEADREGRTLIDAWMRRLGMEVRVDPAGNNVGVYPGSEPGLAPIALGSHTDSVPNGGKYDGALGVLAGVASVRALWNAGVQLRHPVEVINFSAEEATVGGGTFGSRAMAGLLDSTIVEQTALDGRTVAEHLDGAGIDPEAIVKAARPRGSISAYLELHPEQGGVLEAEKKYIGTVEGIVGIRRYEVTFEGSANHAGTTPMGSRKDALVMAAPFVSKVRDVAVSRGLVGTVGAVRVHPGSPNVIPGEVVLSVEIRGMPEEDLDRAEEDLGQVASDSGGLLERVSYKPPASSDPLILSVIESTCEELGFRYRRMASGAGHDAMCMAAITRQAMLFVPSRDGISHSPEEYTDPESCIAGAQVLLGTLLRLDEKLDRSSSREA